MDLSKSEVTGGRMTKEEVEMPWLSGAEQKLLHPHT